MSLLSALGCTLTGKPQIRFVKYATSLLLFVVTSNFTAPSDIEHIAAIGTIYNYKSCNNLPMERKLGHTVHSATLTHCLPARLRQSCNPVCHAGCNIREHAVLYLTRLQS